MGSTGNLLELLLALHTYDSTYIIVCILFLEIFHLFLTITGNITVWIGTLGLLSKSFFFTY